MATGTDAGLLDSPAPQSVYKHGILEQHAIRYATMTASRLNPKRAVLFDGFAGRGRFDGGQAASAEHMMLAAQKMKNSTQIDIFLVERKKKDYRQLETVAEQYRGQGFDIETRYGECGDYLEEVVTYAKGASLFLFLDPCGAMLSFDMLSEIVKGRPNWPRTEFLMNFNADLVRRAGGQYKKGQLDQPGIASLDKVCGGEWWRELALQAHIESGEKDWEAAAEAVAVEYGRRLTRNTPFRWVVAPVRRQLHHQPVYFLIFLTMDPHGLWVFGAAAAKARQKWLDFLGPDQETRDGMLFDTVEEQFKSEQTQAAEEIMANLRELVADGKPKKVVEHTTAIFGDVWGEALEKTFSLALRQLVAAGEVEYVEKGNKPHQHVIRKAS
ncbi:three-Cys-motif partner protein TcmP [Kribbella sp. NPDC050124]|uniref:three-Cys-motif partner protein TcmP n=1 Tax=Kribbella sp. NPDC050124 TaxID=3364114 RepID=UPI0037ADC7A8